MAKDTEYDETTAVASVAKTWGGIGTAIGVISGASALLSMVFEWPQQLVAGVIGVAVLSLLFTGIMIDRQSRRQIKHDKAQDRKLDEIVRSIDVRIGKLEQISMESYRSAIRSEMNSMMRHYPTEHATIIKYAERYFGIGGNWVETDLFMAWVKKENDANRPVNIPHALLRQIQEADTNHEVGFNL